MNEGVEETNGNFRFFLIYIFRTVHFRIILVGNQPDAQFFSNTFIYLNPLLFPATMCSSSGGQLYEYNFWYNHSVLVAARNVGQDGVPS